MKKIQGSKAKREAQHILNAIRQIVKHIRLSSKSSERLLGLSSAQLFVLQKISESGAALSINELAQRTFTHQSSVSVVVTKLVKQKLVQRSSSKKDGRSFEVEISRKGEHLMSKAPALIQDVLMKGLLRITPAERLGLMKGLNSWLTKTGFKDSEPSLFFVDERKK